MLLFLSAETLQTGDAVKNFKSNAWIIATCMVFGAMLVPLQAQSATYSLAVEPAYPPDQAAEVYKPLLDYLDRSTGQHFELVTSRDYHAYWRDLTKGKPVDFAFEEAHFVGFRMRFQGFMPIARTAEPTIYALVAQADYDGQDIRALIAKPVACMPAPSLGFALLAEMYNDNPLAQPVMRSEAATWRDGVQMVFSGEVDGAMVPAHLAEEFYNLPTLARSKPLPGRAFSAAPTVPPEVVQSVAKALESMHEDESLYDVLAELAATRFQAATTAEYAGQEKILSGFHGFDKAKKAAAQPTNPGQ